MTTITETTQSNHELRSNFVATVTAMLVLGLAALVTLFLLAVISVG